MLMNAKIQEVVYAQGYPDELAELMLLESNLKLRRFELPENEVKAMLGDFYANVPGSD
jgi:dCMP deaminase